MGDWTYYSVAMRFDEIASRVSSAREIDNSYTELPLSRWIQRRLDSKRVESVSNYLLVESSRFFASIVVGIHGGQPEWHSLSLDRDLIGTTALSALEENRESEIGILTLSGDEELFAIDGQHRLHGIKDAITRPLAADIAAEQVIVSLVEHDLRAPDRTRKMFMALNRLGKKPSVFDLICLDDADAFAIAVRGFVDSEGLLPFEAISMAGESLSASRREIISLVGLWRIAKELWWDSTGPETSDSPAIHDCLVAFFKSLLSSSAELTEAATKGGDAGRYRGGVSNNVLFRPVFLRALARVVGILYGPEPARIEAWVGRLRYPRDTESEHWRSILWDASKGTILAGADPKAITLQIMSLACSDGRISRRLRVVEKTASRKTVQALSYERKKPG